MVRAEEEEVGRKKSADFGRFDEGDSSRKRDAVRDAALPTGLLNAKKYCRLDLYI